MSEFKVSDNPGFDDLVALMAKLRSDDGCPWDRKQTMQTIRDYFLEEVHEALETIDNKDWDGLKEELGDVVFEAVFLGQIAKDEGHFNIHDSIRTVYEKLVRRHPHVFGEQKVTLAEEVPGLWEKVKEQERKDAPKPKESALDGIPPSLPPLLQALRVSERAVNLGFEWEDLDGVLEKLDEEVEEFKEAVREKQDIEKIEEEVGDMLFTMVNVARKLDVKAHNSLQRTITKFRRRFAAMEKTLKTQEVEMTNCSLDQLEEIWQEVKRIERQ